MTRPPLERHHADNGRIEMRYSHSKEIAALRDAFTAAETKANDLFDAVEMDRDNAAFIAAQNAESDALAALFSHPAENAGDVLIKIRLYMDREIYGWDGERARGANKTCIAAIENDLRDLNRPRVSGRVAEAFGTWAAAWIAMGEVAEDDDAGTVEALANVSGAERALWALPCASPGDYIAKDFVDQMGEQGPEPGTAFMIKDWSDDHEIDGKPAVADLEDCDLGRCMMALGRTDFDAEAWILAMKAVGGHFKLMIDRSDNDARSFWQGEGISDSATKGEQKRHRLLQMLIGGEFHVERTKAVCDLIASDYPEHQMSANQKAAREQGLITGDNAGNGTRAKVEA